MIHFGVIVTCHDKEEYLEPALRILKSYRNCKAYPVVAYNGDKQIPCDFRCSNSGKDHGDVDLTLGGYEVLMQYPQPPQRIVKLSVDSWLLNEQVIVDIFYKMGRLKAGYAGSFWDSDSSVSSDIFFADLRFGNVFEILKKNRALGRFEDILYKSACDLPNWYNIREREPVHPDNRHECKALGWVMHHDLNFNLRDFRVRNATKG